MKSCPVCQQTYSDDTLRFCLQDGSLLRDAARGESALDPAATLVLPAEDLPLPSQQATAVLEGAELQAALAAGAHEGQSAAPTPFASRAARPAEPIRRDKIFISYSHQDRDWLKRFSVSLKPYFRDSEVSAWDDRSIHAGTKWFEEIDRAIQSACVAVLLVTPDFFASEFITDVELPRLKEAALTEGLQILWVAVRASAVSETEIGEYQGLNNPAEPLAGLSQSAQDAKLVEICKEIKRHAKPLPSKSVEPEEMETVAQLMPLRSFEVNLANIRLALADARGRFWVANAQQVKIFEVKAARPVETWLLPPLQWKTALATVWRDQLLISDWEGSLYQFNNQRRNSREQLLYQAQPDDLPFHRLAVGPEGQLAAATWDGEIRVWDAEGQPATPATQMKLEHLPQQLLPLAAGALAVVDDAQTLRLFESDGQERWTWRAPGEIKRLWLSSLGPERRTFVMQIERDRLLKISEGESHAAEIKFDEQIVGLSHCRNSTGEEWIVVAREGGRIDWLSTSLFSVVKDYGLTLNFSVRDILAINDPQQPASLIALGLTAEGQLFTLNEQTATLYATTKRNSPPEPIERFLLEGTGRFLFLLSGSQVKVYRNPAILPARCQVELAEPVKGVLEVNGYKRLIIKLKNTGLIAIHQLEAELNAVGIIETAKNRRRLTAPLAPEETVELEFAVRAKVHGDLLLDLKVEMTDEGGPPPTSIELPFNIEAIASRSGHDGE